MMNEEAADTFSRLVPAASYRADARSLSGYCDDDVMPTDPVIAKVIPGFWILRNIVCHRARSRPANLAESIFVG